MWTQMLLGAGWALLAIAVPAVVLAVARHRSRDRVRNAALAEARERAEFAAIIVAAPELAATADQVREAELYLSEPPKEAL